MHSSVELITYDYDSKRVNYFIEFCFDPPSKQKKNMNLIIGEIIL